MICMTRGGGGEKGEGRDGSTRDYKVGAPSLINVHGKKGASEFENCSDKILQVRKKNLL